MTNLDSTNRKVAGKIRCFPNSATRSYREMINVYVRRILNRVTGNCKVGCFASVLRFFDEFSMINRRERGREYSSFRSALKYNIRNMSIPIRRIGINAMATPSNFKCYSCTSYVIVQLFPIIGAELHPSMLLDHRVSNSKYYFVYTPLRFE